MSKLAKKKTFFTIEQASSTPEKWNWNEFGFLSFIFSLEQCGLQEIDKKIVIRRGLFI